MAKYLPSTRGSAKIYYTFGACEKVVFLIELNKFESGSGAVSVLLSHVIKLIETALCVLFIAWHSD